MILLLPFFPAAQLYGELPDGKGLFTPGQWGLGFFIFGSLALIFGAILPPGTGPWFRKAAGPIFSCSRTVFLSAALSALLLVLAVISAIVFSHRPLLVDDVVQLFQARIFARGMWKAPLPGLPQFFFTQHMILDSSGWYSQYPPGHSALLAIGDLFNAAWTVPLALSVLGAYFLYRFCGEIYGENTARLTLLTLIVTPFYLFLGASFMNHTSAFCFAAAALWLYARWERQEKPVLLFLCGAALGTAFLSRPLCALTTGTVIALWAAPGIVSARRLGAAFCGLAGFGMFAALFLLYNFSTTGNPLIPGYIKLWGESHGMGFHESPWGEMHTPRAGLIKQVINLSMLNDYLFESPIPGCLFLSLTFLLPGCSKSWDRRLLLLFFAFPIIYFFYWHRDAYLGPRFIYLSLLAAVALTIRGIQSVFEYLDRGSIEGPLRKAAARAFGSLIALVLLYSAAAGIPARTAIYASGMNSMKRDFAAEANRNGIESGLIFISVSWGSRILAELRSLGISASAAEKAYRNSDHCLLYQLIRRAQRENLPLAKIEQEIEEFRKFPVKKIPVNKDRTLRLRPDVRPAGECIAELEYDKQDYTVFLPQLNAQDPRLNSPLIFAADLHQENYRLIAKYPDLKAYIYRPPGRYIPLQTSSEKNSAVPAGNGLQ